MLFSFFLCSAFAASSLVLASEPTTPEGRALAYLAREVPAWSPANGCFSCHNNGDATRALYAGQRLHYPIPAKALDDSSRWLAQPGQWDNNGGDRRFSDKGLARIQFASALVDGLEAGAISAKGALKKAAELVAEGQQRDGSWKLDGEATLGSPATYGTHLATFTALRILQKADPERYRTAIERGNSWLRTVSVATILDAAAALLALRTDAGEPAQKQKRHCLSLVVKGQSPDGGWGPYVTSPSEPFDTAVVLLALVGLEDKESAAMRQRGRAYLIAAQEKDGHWQETTRPAGAESYAQRISTTGWATLALLATRGR